MQKPAVEKFFKGLMDGETVEIVFRAGNAGFDSLGELLQFYNQCFVFSHSHQQDVSMRMALTEVAAKKNWGSKFTQPKIRIILTKCLRNGSPFLDRIINGIGQGFLTVK